MLTTQETIDKINALDEGDFTIVINLIDHLSQKETHSKEANNPFHRAWEEGSQNPMTADEVDDFVDDVRRERHARRS